MVWVDLTCSEQTRTQKTKTGATLARSPWRGQERKGGKKGEEDRRGDDAHATPRRPIDPSRVVLSCPSCPWLVCCAVLPRRRLLESWTRIPPLFSWFGLDLGSASGVDWAGARDQTRPRFAWLRLVWRDSAGVCFGDEGWSLESWLDLELGAWRRGLCWSGVWSGLEGGGLEFRLESSAQIS